MPVLSQPGWSMRPASAGTSTSASTPTDWIFPSSITTTPFSSVRPSPRSTRAARMASGRSATAPATTRAARMLISVLRTDDDPTGGDHVTHATGDRQRIALEEQELGVLAALDAAD